MVLSPTGRFPQTFGRYCVERFVGRGGQGVVYQARHVDLDRVVALKLLRPEYAGNAAAVRAFIEEGRIAARFDHPNLCRVYEIGLCDGVPFLALQYVDGAT